MLVLALDTTTRAGSVALARDGELIEAFAGDAARTHATRLPGDILSLLSRHDAVLADIDLFAVAAGPGSFTGLRIGIATIQGLAFADQRPVVAVSALEALVHSAEEAGPGLRPTVSGTTATPETTGRTGVLLGAWMDAQRGEVYAELYRSGTFEVLEPAVAAEPGVVLDGWSRRIRSSGEGSLLIVGDGALAYRVAVEARWPGVVIGSAVPLLAPAIARLGARAAAGGLAGPPHAIRPLYVRRPDAELARDRKRAAGPSHASAADSRSRTDEHG